MLYRYELIIDTDLQGCGIFTELDNVSTEDEYQACMQDIQELTDPYMQNIVSENTISFFTENGREKFKDTINKIISIYSNNGLFDVIETTINEALLADNDIVYKDDNQILIKYQSADRKLMHSKTERRNK